jgi:hypothetical protein
VIVFICVLSLLLLLWLLLLLLLLLSLLLFFTLVLNPFSNVSVLKTHVLGPRGKRRRGLQFPRMSDRTHWSRKELLDEAREIDTFNLSNDAWYIRGEASSTWNRR